MADQDRFTRTAASGWAPSARAVRDTWAVDPLGGPQLVQLYARHVEQWLRYPHPAVPAFLPADAQHMLSA